IPLCAYSTRRLLLPRRTGSDSESPEGVETELFRNDALRRERVTERDDCWAIDATELDGRVGATRGDRRRLAHPRPAVAEVTQDARTRRGAQCPGSHRGDVGVPHGPALPR